MPRTLLGFAAFSIVLSLHAAKGASSAILHLHETLIGIGFHIGAANRFVLIRTHPSTSVEQELEISQAFRYGGDVHVFAAVFTSHLALAGVKLAV